MTVVEPARIDHHRPDAALRVVLHNPSRANALTHGMLRELAALVEGPEPAAGAAVILSGAGGRHFCSGLDLSGVAADALVGHLRAGEELLFAASAAIANCARPVVAAVGGAAVGGGLKLALACDWRIAAAEARFAMPAARLGVVYSPAGLERALAVLGPAGTRRLFLTGRAIDAQEAFALGLVDEVVPRAELEAAVARTAAELAGAAPGAVAGTRAVIRALTSGDPDASAMAERERERAFSGAELAAGLRAFAAGRPARPTAGERP